MPKRKASRQSLKQQLMLRLNTTLREMRSSCQEEIKNLKTDLKKAKALTQQCQGKLKPAETKVKELTRQYQKKKTKILHNRLTKTKAVTKKHEKNYKAAKNNEGRFTRALQNAKETKQQCQDRESLIKSFEKTWQPHTEKTITKSLAEPQALLPKPLAITLGDPAPLFKANATNHQIINLSDLIGKTVVLYFYPKDDTPGCTQESNAFAKHHQIFESLNVAIIGISQDNLKSHEKFKAKCALPFELIADSDGMLCQQYGVIKDKTLFGKKYKGIERSTFLIDEKGIIRQIWRKVKVSGHVDAVLEAVRTVSEQSYG